MKLCLVSAACVLYNKVVFMNVFEICCIYVDYIKLLVTQCMLLICMVHVSIHRLECDFGKKPASFVVNFAWKKRLRTDKVL